MSVIRLISESRLNAAAEWILSELETDGIEVSLETMRAVAERELKRPRDPLHGAWAASFIEHCKQYERAKAL